jgi:flagellar hook assembly protein FlgD
VFQIMPRSLLIGVVVAAALGVTGSPASSSTPPSSGSPVRLWIVQGPSPGDAASRPRATLLSSPAQLAAAAGAVGGAARAAVAAPAAMVATVDAGTSFSLVGVGLPCRTTLAPHVGAQVRASADGAHWSAWWAVGLETQVRGGFLRGPGAVAPDPLWTGPARWLQYRLLLNGRVVTLSQAAAAGVGVPSLCFIDSPERAADAAVASAARAPLAAGRVGMTAAPAVVTRSQWGANEALRRGSPCYATVKMAFVHHTDNANTYTRQQAPSVVRGIYAYHTEANGWSDIGYNFLIDRWGTIYEGRYGGVTKGVIGAQTLGFNTGSTGVALIGTFQTVAPPAAAVSALERLLAWKLDVHHVNPLGKATMTCRASEKFRYGQRVVFNAISGHRDACFTDCPGTKLYKLLPTIRKVVAATGLPKIYDLQLSHSAFSPNGDGQYDTVNAGFTMPEAAAWTVDVTDASGTAVRQFSGNGTTAAITWDGRNATGGRLPDGRYTITANATSPKGTARVAQASVVIDTVKPVVSHLTVTPVFSPNGDGLGDTAAIPFTTSEHSLVRVAIVSAGKEVGVVRDWRWAAAGAVAAAWDGRIAGSSGLVTAPNGRYTVSVTVRDSAGNQGSGSTLTVVDDTLGFRSSSPVAFSPNGDGRADATTIGCTLTRKATVTLTIAQGAITVRVFKLGTCQAGRVTAVWDGRDAAGRAPVDGLYKFTFSATNSIGTVTLSGSVLIDLVKPTLVVPAQLSVAVKHTASVHIVGHDPYSAIIHITAVVTSSTGAIVKRLDWGWVGRGVTVMCSFKPVTAGVYRVTAHAVDRAQNHEASAASCVVTAK